MNTTKRYRDWDRLTQAEKDANDQAWYRKKIQSLDTSAYHSYGFGGVAELLRMKTNYDLFNNKINESDFNYVIRPYTTDPTSADLKLPANFTNKDIVSNKIRALLGMEMRRPLDYKILAINEEATTRKEEEYFNRIKEYVTAMIMQPIEAEIRKQAYAQLNGRQPSQEEVQEIEKQVQESIKAATPPEVEKYMARDHQDPAEAMMSDLFEYVTNLNRIKETFNNGWKHGLISAYEVYYVGEINDNPVVKVVNPIYFDCSKSHDTEFIEDGEWAVYEMHLTPSEVINIFSKELTDEEIDEIYSLSEGRGVDPEFTFTDIKVTNFRKSVRVLHVVWKSLRKIGYLTYEEKGQQYTTQVDEEYELQSEFGDISIEWVWIPEVHQGYKIGTKIYKKMGPLPGQYIDSDRFFNVKLPYHGVIYDNVNAEPISALDRMKTWQFYYNVIMFRIEKLMASDKGKIALINSKLLPKEMGIDLNKWLYFVDALKIGFMDPTAENRTTDVSTAAKELDLSMMADIQKYVELATYIEEKCGRAIGITPEIEGQIANSAAVSNTEQNINMVSNILEPYFNLHERVKRNVLTSLLELSRYIYSRPEKAAKLSFVLDDMSLKTLTIDNNLLSSSTYGLFVSNSSKIELTKQLIQQLSQAALQNDKANFSDVIKVTMAESLHDAREILEQAERDSHNREMELEEIKKKNELDIMERQETIAQKQHEREKELIILKEAERRETELQKQAMLSMGFNEDKDMDNDGTPDVFEVYKHGVDTKLKARKQELDEAKFKHQKEIDKEKLRLDEKKINKTSSASK